MLARPTDATTVVAALRDEVRPLLERMTIESTTAATRRARLWRGRCSRAPLDVLVTGEGRHHAKTGLARYLEELAEGNRRFLLVGVAGALSPGLEPGALVLADRVVSATGERASRPSHPWHDVGSVVQRGVLATAEEVVTSAARRRELWLAIGSPSAAAVDMETLWWAQELDSRGCPWASLRAISDGFEEDLPGYLARCFRERTGISRGRVIAHAVSRPWTVPSLLRLAARVRSAALQLATMVEREISSAAPDPGSSR